MFCGETAVVSGELSLEVRKEKHLRGEEMRERLTSLLVDDEDGRDFIVEECAGDTGHAVHDMHAFVILCKTLREITLEMRGTVLVGIDLQQLA